MSELLTIIKKAGIVVFEEIRSAETTEDLDRIRTNLFGKKSPLAKITKTFPNLSIEERKSVGRMANEVKEELEAALKNRWEQIEKFQESRETWLDESVPGEKPLLGHLHPTTQVLRETNSFFRYYGYSVVEGPEIETEENNFEKTNLPKDHPARDLQDTLYIKAPEILLRTHTSSVEVRTMLGHKPPFRVVIPGKCYRNETSNPTNNSTFYQYEGLVVEKGVTLAELKGTLIKLTEFLYDKDVKTRFRCKYYPQVEPGAGLDVACTLCGGKGCRTCKWRGWIEVLGAGMVHPNMLRACGIDPEEWTGFAFGIGLDRLVMLKFGIKDIRDLYNGNLVFER